MKFITVILVLLSLASINLSAGENAKGFYLGAGYGSANYQDTDELYNSWGVDAGEAKKDSSGFKLYTGYQFNNIIAVEIGYTNFGEYKAIANDFSTSPAALSVCANVGYSLLDSQLRLFSNLGLADIMQNYSKQPDDTTIKLVEGALAIVYGLGIAYEPNALHGVGFRVAFEKYAYRSEVEYLNYMAKYYQSLSLIYAGVQYKF